MDRVSENSILGKVELGFSSFYFYLFGKFDEFWKWSAYPKIEWTNPLINLPLAGFRTTKTWNLDFWFLIQLAWFLLGKQF